MSRRKKVFDCGHKGYGQTCHKCAQKEAVWQKKRQEKDDWEATFCNDPIDLSALPRNVVVKARQIIRNIQTQQSYTQFRGKRLRHDRYVISIPVTRNYRLLCRDYGTSLVPEVVISHEDYNVCKPGS